MSHPVSPATSPSQFSSHLAEKKKPSLEKTHLLPSSPKYHLGHPVPTSWLDLEFERAHQHSTWFWWLVWFPPLILQSPQTVYKSLKVECDIAHLRLYVLWRVLLTFGPCRTLELTGLVESKLLLYFYRINLAQDRLSLDFKDSTFPVSKQRTLSLLNKKWGDYQPVSFVNSRYP